MRILVDSNLGSDWIPLFEGQGWEAVHWPEIGYEGAADWVIMQYARRHGYVVFTHDLEATAAIVATAPGGPGVLQIHARNVLPAAMGALTIETLRRFRSELTAGSLVAVDAQERTARVLPRPGADSID